MADLENLSIQITASTSQASNSLNKLIDKLGQLGSAIETNTSGTLINGLFNLASGLSRVSDSMSEISTAKIGELSKVFNTLATTGDNLSKLNLGSFSGFAESLHSLDKVNITADQFSGIQVLSNSMGKLAGAYIEKASTAIPALAQGLRQLPSTLPAWGDQLTSLASGLSLLGRAKVVNAQDVGKIAEGLKGFQDLHFDNIEELSRLIHAISSLGYKSMSQAIDNIPRLSVAFTELTSALANTPRVSAETLRLAEAMAQLATASRSAGISTQSTSTGINSLRGVFQSIIPTVNKVQRRTFSLAAMFGKLYASYFLVIRAFRGLGKAISVSSSLTEVENVVASVFNNMTEKIDDFADTSMYKFGLAELSAKQYASKFQAMGLAMGITSKQVSASTDFLADKLAGQKRDIEGVADSYENLGDSMADMSINLTKLVSDYASFFNMDYDDVAKDFESIFTGSTRPMRAYGIDLTNATLQEWALKNGIDANVKAMTQAEKSMLRYQYVMANSARVMNDYQITMNNWANVTRTIGQQFQKLGSIIGTGLINVFKPVLIRFRDFMNVFIELTQKALNAVGKLLGWQIEIEEVGISMDDGMEDYVDSIDDATGAAKKLNAQLRSIDELNNLTSNDNKGGSGSGGILSGISGGGAGASGGGWKLVPYESDIASWRDLGKRISDKIKDALDSIRWGDVFEKVRNFATNLAEFLNGLIQPETFYAVGKTIANAINTAIEFAYSFGTTFDFENLGESIAEGINGFFENFNFKKLAKTINTWVNGIATTIKTAFKKIKWKKVFSGLFDFASNLSLESILGISAVAGIANIKKIPDLIKKITAASSALNISISAIAKSLGGVLAGFAEFASVYTIMKKVYSGTSDINKEWGKLVTSVGIGAAGLTASFGAIGTGISGAIAIITSWIAAAKVADEETQKFIGLVMNDALSNPDGIPITKLFENFMSGTSNATQSIREFIQNASEIDSINGDIKSVVDEIDKIQLAMEQGVKSVEEGNAELATLFEELAILTKNKFERIANNLLSVFGEGGFLYEAYKEMGLPVDEYSKMIVESEYEVSDRVDAIVQEMAEIRTQMENPLLSQDMIDTLQRRVTELSIELRTLSGETTEADKAISDWNNMITNLNLDWSQFMFDDGTFNASEFEDFVKDIKSNLDTYKGALDEATPEIEKNLQNLINTTSDPQKKLAFQMALDFLPETINNMKSDAELQVNSALEYLEKDFLDKIPEMFDESRTEWSTYLDNNPWYESLFGDNPEGTDRKFTKRIEGMFDDINGILDEQFKGYNEINTDKAKKAGENIFNALFGLADMEGDLVKTDVIDVDQLQFKINGIVDNMGDMVDSAIDEAGLGKDIALGILLGFDEVSDSEYKTPSERLAQTIEAHIRDAADSNSPAKKFYPVGEDIVLGVLEGFKEVDFASEMSGWWDESVKPFFSIEKWEEIGQSASDGLLPKITAMCNAIIDSFDSLYYSVSNIWSDLVTSINNAMANLKVPTFEIDGKFDLSQSQVPKIDVKFYAQGGMPQTGSLFFAGEAGAELLGSVNGRTTVASNGEITGISDTIRQTSSEEIALLRQQNQLLQGILQKEFGITKDQVFKSVRSSASEYTKMTGNPAFA